MKRGSKTGLGAMAFTLFLACGGSNTYAPDAGSDAQVADVGLDLPAALDIPDSEITQADTGTDVTVNDPGAPIDQPLPQEDPGSDLPPEDEGGLADISVDVPALLDLTDAPDVQDTGATTPLDILVDPGAPPTDEGGQTGGPFLGYILDGYYIVDYTFHEVEMESLTSTIKLQTLEIVLPPDFLAVEAQISIRGDLDSFPMAFMTFLAHDGEATTQCGTMSGMPQLPNNILDDQFRIAFPRPENLASSSIYAPATPPYDYKPVECPERFEGQETLEIGMAGAFIYPPGEAGNQGPPACGGWGCPNDARVILRFELPPDGPGFDAGSPPDMSDSGGQPATDLGVPDWGWQESALGTCEEPSEFTLSATHPVAQVTHLGSALHVVPWPPFTAACPQNKPPFSLEYFYKVTLSDYGLVHFSVSHDTPPWPFEQTWLDILSGCGEALACGQSYQDLHGIMQPGEYIINLTEAPPGEIFPADQTDWSFTLTAELTPLTWSEEVTVASSITTELARNNTSMSLRDSDGLLHAVWVQGGTVTHGWQETLGNGWAQAPLPMMNPLQAQDPTIASPDGTILLAAWTETLPDAQKSVVLVWSDDKGQTWSAPTLLSGSDHSARAVSLYAGLTVAEIPSVAIAWTDETSQKVWSRAWTGGSWGSEGWTPALVLEQGAGTSQNVALGGAGSRVFAVWEDTRSGSAQIFYTSSMDGGITWEPESVLGVSPGAAPDSAGERPSVGVGPDDQVFVSYEHLQYIRLARSLDDGLSFEVLYGLGPGNYSNLIANTSGLGAIAWEFFDGDPLDDTVKTVGLVFTLNGFENTFGPFILPGSPLQTHRVMSSVSISEDTVDVFWIDVSTGERQLTHQQLAF